MIYYNYFCKNIHIIFVNIINGDETMKLCAICHKNVATVFTAKIDNGKPQIIGICMECAEKMGLNMMNEFMESSGITPDEIKSYTEEINNALENVDINDIMNNNMFSSLFNSKDSMSDDLKFEGIDDLNKCKSKEKDKSSIFIKNKKKNLNKYGVNLTKKAMDGNIDPVIGRDKEIDRVIQILNRRTKNNPILIGEPGVGKTAIAEGLAVRIVNKQVPIKLFDMEVYLLDLTAVVAGTQFRGQFESRMKSIIDEVKENNNIILVIDEIHNIIGAGEAQGGSLNAANILKPALARGEMQVIGATTIDEYRKYIEKDSALERRFQNILVEEPSIEESIDILKGIKGYYENYHKVYISDSIIEETVKLSKRYITDRYLPDKAIDIIDEASSSVNLKNHSLVKLKILNDDLKNLEDEILKLTNEEKYKEAAEYKIKECRVKDDIKALKEKGEFVSLTLEDIVEAIESWTNIPIKKINEDEAKDLMNLEKRLHTGIIGQDEGVIALSKAIRRNRLGFRKKKKPSSFIFVGPTGVGKTALVKALAKELFNDEEAIIRMDMSEYMEKHAVSKLTGAPPGYVGYDEGGQLTEKVRRKPYSIILLDEIEKAHPDIFNMLLQILEDGRLTDNQGRTVYFDNTVIIMTSNAGTNFKENKIGFGNESYEMLECKVKDSLKEFFKPEFINRIDEIIVFNRLKKKELYKIIDLMLDEVKDDLKEKNITIELKSDVKDYILKIGYDEKFGARPLRRAIQRNIEDEIVELYFMGKIKSGSIVNIKLRNDKLAFEILE